MEKNSFAKHLGCCNPLISHKYGADPYALVFNGRVYIYLTNDIYEYDEFGKLKNNTYGKINKITVISSSDFVNWTDHGEIPVAGADGAAKWANHSWAPAIAHKVIDGKDKFFLYFANDASNIGVLTADSPIGPFTDPLGKSLINREIPGVKDVTWCFDPAVLVDDDGSAYLFFGGGLPSPTHNLHPKTGRVIKLGDDMVSTVGEAVLIDAPALFEDSGIHKYKNKYYYTYCSNFVGPHPDGYPPIGEIAYMVSDNPMGPYTYIGPILKNPAHFFGVGGNNHHAVFEFKGKWYITYHAQTVCKAHGLGEKGYRSPHINELHYDDNGMIKQVQADYIGVNPDGTINPFERVEAETIAWSKGVATVKCTEKGGFVDEINLCVTDIDDGDFIAVSGVDFGDTGADKFYANIASLHGGEIELRADSLDGEILANIGVGFTGGNDVFELKCFDIKKITGIHDLYMIFKGEHANLFNFDYWKFSR